MSNFDESEGKWRTIRGRRVFIAEGQSLGEAMAKSGKFKREDIREGKRELSLDDRIKKSRNIARKTNEKNFDNSRRKMEKNEHKYASKYELRDSDFKNQARKNIISEKEKPLQTPTKRVLRNLPKYSKEDERELNHEMLQKKLAEYKAKKQSNNKVDPYDDPESNESQRLQDIQRRYDEYLQDTEKRGASYGEIAYVDSLRGKELDDFEKELDDYEEKKYNKTSKAHDKLEKSLKRQDTIKNYVEKKQSNHKIDKSNELLQELKHNQSINKRKKLENRIDIDYLIDRVKDTKANKEFLEELKYNKNINKAKGLENRVDIDYVIQRLKSSKRKGK